RFQPDALIEVLHTAQDLFGYLQDDILLYVAHGLKLPPSRVYGVATFYHFFTCAAGENRESGANGPFVSVETARCLGACGLAPVVVFDGEVCGTVEPAEAEGRMKGWLEHGPG